MKFFYTFPVIAPSPSGQTVLDWQGCDPYTQEHTLAVNDAASYPQIVQQLFSPQECDAIIALGEASIKQKASVDERADLASRDYRISDIAWIEPRAPAQWLFHRLAVLFAQSNITYRFDLVGFAEALQYTCYGAGQYFAWHADIGNGETAARKLSLTIQLSEPSDYDGGHLQFHGGADMPAARLRGSGVFFPAFLAHQVTPVTRGLRRSLVVWAYGPQFR